MARLVSALLAFLILPACAVAQGTPRLDDIRLPPGFEIEVLAGVPGARSMAVAEELGLIFVGTRDSRLYAVRYRDRGTGGAAVVRLRSDLKVANGIAWRKGYLYVAEQHRIVRFRGDDATALAAARPEVLFDGLPDKSHHGWRYAAFGPDGFLYVAVGAPCNVCAVRGFEGTIIRLRPARPTPEIFARGIRNSVGIDFQPATGVLFFTDNGADWMGDDSPPDELNRAPRAGLDFGYPYFGGGADRTPAFMGKTPPRPVAMPVVRFGAHVAALGVHFYRGGMFPKEYRGDAFVAQHGSWNRSVPDGYRVVRVRFDRTGRAVFHEPFAEGWLGGGRVRGRPVDVKELPDGSLLVSDDRAGAIYRIAYRGE